MARIFENNDRRVIPNFRTLSKTIFLGELDSFQAKLTHFVKNDLEDYIEDYLSNQEISYAGDLLCAALVNNELENPVVKEAAEFILKNENKGTLSLMKLARRILGYKIQESNINVDKIDEFLERNTKNIIYEKIKKLKELSKDSIANPFVFSELARLYSIIGQRVNAHKSIVTALNIAPTNRYILRSFSRLMFHLGDLEYAHDILRKSPNTRTDPWLLASEIAFASLRGRNSINIKRGIELLNSRNFLPLSISELASAIGTVELLDGNRKKGRVFFEQALIKPNDNSLAQVEWANNKDKLFDLDLKKFKVGNDYEAKALDSFYNSDWKKSIEYAEAWFIDMPFSRRAAEFGNHIAAVYLEDQETSVKFCQAGLVSNPNDTFLLNNIAYSYALLNNWKRAFEYLGKIKIDEMQDVKHKICFKATTGLAKFRSGDIEGGRELYLEAIMEAKKNKLEYYNWLAIINFAREEFRIKSQYTGDLVNILNRIPEKDDEITMFKNRILDSAKSSTIVLASDNSHSEGFSDLPYIKENP